MATVIDRFEQDINIVLDLKNSVIFYSPKLVGYSFGLDNKNSYPILSLTFFGVEEDCLLWLLERLVKDGLKITRQIYAKKKEGMSILDIYIVISGFDLNRLKSKFSLRCASKKKEQVDVIIIFNNLIVPSLQLGMFDYYGDKILGLDLPKNILSSPFLTIHLETDNMSFQKVETFNPAPVVKGIQ